MFHPIIGTTKNQHNVTFTLGVPQLSAAKIELSIQKDGELVVSYPLKWAYFDGTRDVWSVTLGYMDAGLYFYRFMINETVTIGCDEDFRCAEHGAPFQLTVYQPAYAAPDFLRGGIMYQIMVDRFYSVDRDYSRDNAVYREDWGGVPEYRPVNGKILNNDFFGGNLRGVLAKLDYLESLGVTCIYFNPIFEANSNHKYDTADYMRVDPAFGTESDLRRLVDAARERGISVILDGVFSHTGDDSIYFNRYHRYNSVGAYESPDSPYASWYRFSYWPDRYDSWWGIDILPEVDENSSSYVDFIAGPEGVLAHWMRTGIAGWRLDVADELPDDFLAKISARVHAERPDALVLGEVWEDASNKISYSQRRKYFLGDELNSVTNYVFRSAIFDYLSSGDARTIARKVQTVVLHYPPEILHVLMNVVGTHDTPRMLTMLSGVDGHAMSREQRAHYRLTDEEYDRARSKLFLAAVLQYTLPGIPCVFYGDEAGIQGFEDPFNRRTYPWGREDERILGFYRKLGEIRKNCPELGDGAYQCLYAGGSVYIFLRTDGVRRLYVGVNLGVIPFVKASKEPCFDAFEGTPVETFTLSPMSFRIVRNFTIGEN